MSLGRTLKPFALAGLLACAGSACAFAGQNLPQVAAVSVEKDDASIPTAIRAAKDEAKRTGKDILVVLNVSDWGSWCEKLREEFLNKPEFLEEVRKDFVIVELDFPQKRQPENADEHRRAVDYAAKYHITGFPIVLLLDHNGAAYSRSGYTGGTCKDYADHLRAMRELRRKRDTLITKALRNKGDIRAVLLGNALRTIDGSLATDYPELFEELRRVDPTDRTGVIIDYDISQLQLRASRITLATGDAAAGLWEYDAFLSAHPELDKRKLQRVMTLRHAQKLKMIINDESPIAFRERLAEELQEILNLDPKSPLAPLLNTYLEGNANHLIRLKEELAKRASEAPAPVDDAFDSAAVIPSEKTEADPEPEASGSTPNGEDEKHPVSDATRGAVTEGAF